MRLTALGWIVIGSIVVLGAGGYFVAKRNPHPPSTGDGPSCSGLLGRPLRVGVVTWPGYAGGIVANHGFRPNKESIYYKKYNLCVDFQLMEDVDARQKAFARGGPGGLDIVWSTVDFWANELPGMRGSGLNARAVMQVDWSRGGDAIVADNSIQRVEDLYGKTISLTLFTPSHWLLEYNLQHSSLNEHQQTEIVKALIGKSASPDARADFVSGKVDAAVVWEPDVSAATRLRKNSHVLVSSEQARKLIADVMVAKESFIRDHRDAVRAFVEGWIVDGTVEANVDPDEVVRLLMENEPVYKELGKEVTKQNLSTVRWADLADNVEMFNLDARDPEPLFDTLFKRASTSWAARGYISAPVAAAVAKDDSFVREIYGRHPSVMRVVDQIAPAPPSAQAAAPIFDTRLTVNFTTGSWDLDDTARRVIDKEALLPKAFSGAYLRVEGNTDNVGIAASNRVLSQRRAQAVVDYLVDKYHLSRNQFMVEGNGPDKPVASNNTPEGRAKNRRTDLGAVKSPA